MLPRTNTVDTLEFVLLSSQKNLTALPLLNASASLRRLCISSPKTAVPGSTRPSYWVMSLRGYGERMCNVGNIFSGLFCTMGDRLPALRTVRKPTGRAADATRKRTWRNSKALALRRRQLAPALKKLAGGELRAEDTAGEA